MPKLRHKYGSVPTTSHHFMNSSVPNSLLSVPIHASSGLNGVLASRERQGLHDQHLQVLDNVHGDYIQLKLTHLGGRDSLGPTPSSQW